MEQEILIISSFPSSRASCQTMFSFLGIESKPVESKPAEPVVPSHDAGASSMFGGMAVQQQQGSGNDDAAVSSFNFINEEEQAPTQSAFSFLQEPANDQESSSQGFSFMSSEGETPQGAESSFSFMSSAPTTQVPTSYSLLDMHIAKLSDSFGNLFCRMTLLRRYCHHQQLERPMLTLQDWRHTTSFLFQRQT